MSAQVYTLGSAINSTASGSAVNFSQQTAPFFPGMKVKAEISGNGFSGTAKIQHKDNSADSWTDALSTGSLTTSDRHLTGELTLKRYVRYDVTRSAGDVDLKLWASV